MIVVLYNGRKYDKNPPTHFTSFMGWWKPRQLVAKLIAVRIRIFSNPQTLPYMHNADHLHVFQGCLEHTREAKLTRWHASAQLWPLWPTGQEWIPAIGTV